MMINVYYYANLQIVAELKDPEPPEPWTAILKTTSDTIPVQEDIVTKKTAGVEDCLHLNVYTKQLGKTEGGQKSLCPVMVWIHGGAFIIGSNTKDIYNPEYLLQKDIVLVVINYRLGAFGKLKVFAGLKGVINFLRQCN